ncbi:MAG: hypothetical protein Q8O67_18060 [Deltaproteobacteria bacterium]|nr:hypothetical protein [Deltaproteobacteria bacterium]
MDPIRLGARVEHKSLDELESGFADRVTARALFLARGQVVVGGDVAVGARVHVEVLLSSGEPGLVVDGVVAWAISDKPPPGREPGLGVAITSVDDVTAARLKRMAARPGAGGRVRVPGQRLADRLRLGQPLLHPTPNPAGGWAADAAAVVAPPATIAPAMKPRVELARTMTPSSSSSVLGGPRGAGATDDDDRRGAPSPSTSPSVMPASAADFPTAADLSGGAALGEVLSNEDTPVSTIRPSQSTPTFASLFPPTEAADFLHGVTSEMPARPRPRLMGLLADRALGDSEPETASTNSGVGTQPQLSLDGLDDSSEPESEAEEQNFLEAPTLDGIDEVGDTTPPSEEEVPSSSSSASSEGGLESLPDAPPLRSPFGDDEEPARPFESQSTDVDLLASISAGDIVALDLAALQARAAAAAAELPQSEPGPPEFEAPATDQGIRDLEDLPSADADLLSPGPAGGWHEEPGDWELRTDHSADDDVVDAWPSLELGETLVLDLRSLPDPEPWPVWSDLVDARAVGVFCSYGKRGLQNVESFTWPTTTTKRFSRGEHADEPQPDVPDNDVFAGGDVDLFASSPELDPFAPTGTDPRLNVEGVVMRAVRAAHGDGDGDVFSSSGDGDATRDEMPLPALAIATPNNDPSSSDGDTDRELRRPPPKGASS